MGLIDKKFILFVLQQIITNIKMILFLLSVIAIAHILESLENNQLKKFLADKDIISFEFNGKRIVIDLQDESSDSEDEKESEYEFKNIPHIDESMDMTSISEEDNDEEQESREISTPLIIENISPQRVFHSFDLNDMEKPEVIKNIYRSESSLLEALSIVKDEENTLINDTTTTTDHKDDNNMEDNSSNTSQSTADCTNNSNATFIKNFKNTHVASLEPISSTENISNSCDSRSVSLSSDARESQLPVKDLILKFESIHSNSSSSSPENSFLNNNILNNGETKSDDTIIAKRTNNNGFDVNTIEEVNSLHFYTPAKKELIHETNMIKNEIINSASSKASSNVFFTPYIQSSVIRPPGNSNGANYLVFKDDKKNIKAAAVARLIDSKSSCSVTKTVVTQKIVVNGTIIPPDASQ
ncbi:hypothetical protein HANVADRAFT_2694 [Hanseniaspora valbyensis NRRL Y-1626]|uniref:Uncharacterized protein n=1 Tax=Hanseniaspora valbyensis NRRL Y-1626 TaxID=766949 RepID=A0A1B7TCZ6_9ASCO|nr:hypothetical protein HANVADRAFT_2694 [Hanseniaspora valbyensis NRRL Y-1626]